jgi:hypothetical protein
VRPKIGDDVDVTEDDILHLGIADDSVFEEDDEDAAIPDPCFDVQEADEVDTEALDKYLTANVLLVEDSQVWH